MCVEESMIPVQTPELDLPALYTPSSLKKESLYIYKVQG